MKLTLNNLLDITISIVKFNEAIKVLSDITSDEKYEYLDEMEDYFKLELKEILCSENEYNTIEPTINRVNEILEAFEIKHDVNKIFDNLENLKIDPEIVLQVIINCDDICESLILLFEEKLTCDLEKCPGIRNKDKNYCTAHICKFGSKCNNCINENFNFDDNCTEKQYFEEFCKDHTCSYIYSSEASVNIFGCNYNNMSCGLPVHDEGDKYCWEHYCKKDHCKNEDYYCKEHLCNGYSCEVCKLNEKGSIINYMHETGRCVVHCCSHCSKQKRRRIIWYS